MIADQLLDDLLLTIDLANAAGQHSAAITGIKAIGNEMFDLFTERRENLNINLDISHIRSNAQLRAYMVNEYGEKLTDQIMAHWHSPKMIEHSPQQAHSAALRADNAILEDGISEGDIGLCGPVNQAENRALGHHGIDPAISIDHPAMAENRAQNRGESSDRARPSAPIADLDAKTAKLALDSLQNSQAPKLK